MLVASLVPAWLLEYKDLHMLRMNRAPTLPVLPRPALWSGQEQGIRLLNGVGENGVLIKMNGNALWLFQLN